MSIIRNHQQRFPVFSHEGMPNHGFQPSRPSVTLLRETSALFKFGRESVEMKFFSAITLIVIFAFGCSPSTAQQPSESESTAPSAQKKAASAENTQDETSETPEKEDEEMNLETATFAGGCFWCTEAVFLALDGVDSVLPGYMGGKVKDPTYKQVCNGTTGHAEVIQIKFDADKISFEELLFVFFKTHDPTTLNRQGNDVGTQYRSAVFFHSDEQKEAAESIKKKIDAANYYANPVVTEITAASTMYVAEDYHINYFNNNPTNGYCRAVIPAKLDKLKKLFGDKLKSQFQN